MELVNDLKREFKPCFSQHMSRARLKFVRDCLDDPQEDERMSCGRMRPKGNSGINVIPYVLRRRRDHKNTLLFHPFFNVKNRGWRHHASGLLLCGWDMATWSVLAKRGIGPCLVRFRFKPLTVKKKKRTGLSNPFLLHSK